MICLAGSSPPTFGHMQPKRSLHGYRATCTCLWDQTILPVRKLTSIETNWQSDLEPRYLAIETLVSKSVLLCDCVNHISPTTLKRRNNYSPLIGIDNSIVSKVQNRTEIIVLRSAAYETSYGLKGLCDMKHHPSICKSSSSDWVPPVSSCESYYKA